MDLDQHADLLTAILDDMRDVANPSVGDVSRILRRHPMPDGRVPSKSRVLRGYQHLCVQRGQEPDARLVALLRVKPTRTISGVAPVTVLTEPYPCPGECIFCPEVAGMPKSYLADEPGAMRAVSYHFDPFDQTGGRVNAMAELGHSVDKVELLILGATWSCYPAAYQEWFVRRCLEALNRVEASTLEEAQRLNETAAHRNVGLVVETRPDLISAGEVRRLRWLGVTKVQLGLQSLNDEILNLNRRGHSVADARRAMRLLRLAGFKIAVHWMPNLLGATPEGDLADFRRLWDNPAYRPDELKIYPTALLPNTALYDHWRRGAYQPYDEETLVELLVECKALIPPYCRVNRLMRDIPSHHIVAGVKKSNLRQLIRREMGRRGMACRCVRCREVRQRAVDTQALRLQHVSYDTDATREWFLSMTTAEDRLAGYLRLSLPQAEPTITELRECAIIREVHVFGPAQELGRRRGEVAQHAGLGSRLIEAAVQIARQEGYRRVAVIAAVGTRPYYRRRGFELGELYMQRSI